MAQSPPAQAGKVRVLRIINRVTETYIDTTAYPTAAQQIAAARALPEKEWSRRIINNIAGEDRFEYDVVGSDV